MGPLRSPKDMGGKLHTTRLTFMYPCLSYKLYCTLRPVAHNMPVFKIVSPIFRPKAACVHL